MEVSDEKAIEKQDLKPLIFPGTSWQRFPQWWQSIWDKVLADARSESPMWAIEHILLFSGSCSYCFHFSNYERLGGDRQYTNTQILEGVTFAILVHNCWWDLNVTLGIPIESLLTSVKLGSANGWKMSWTVVESLGSCPASEPETWHDTLKNRKMHTG